MLPRECIQLVRYSTSSTVNLEQCWESRLHWKHLTVVLLCWNEDKTDMLFYHFKAQIQLQTSSLTFTFTLFLTVQHPSIFQTHKPHPFKENGGWLWRYCQRLGSAPFSPIYLDKKVNWLTFCFTLLSLKISKQQKKLTLKCQRLKCHVQIFGFPHFLRIFFKDEHSSFQVKTLFFLITYSLFKEVN